MRIFILALTFMLCGLAFRASAQQQWHYSQYMNNNYLLNPAEGGTEKFTDLKLGIRTQWVQLDGAPLSMFVSGHHPLNKNKDMEGVKDLAHHGVGGYISRDVTGPTSRTSVYGSYSYQLPLTQKFTMSFGAFLGIKQYFLDKDQLIWEDDVPDAAVAGSATNYLPDASFGIWGYGDAFYFGASAFQLLENELDLGDVEEASVTIKGELARHYFLTAGSKHHITEKVFVVPSVVVKGVEGAPWQFDLNAKVRYEDQYYVGASYRNQDAIVLLVGATLKNQYDIGYSYDVNISNLRAYNTGSHEILVGYRIHHHATEAPAQFW